MTPEQALVELIESYRVGNFMHRAKVVEAIRTLRLAVEELRELESNVFR